MQPLVFTLFGLTGNLATSKIIPALYQLFEAHKLPEQTHFFGYGRRDYSREDFENLIRSSIPQSETVDQFLALWTYVKGTFDTRDGFTSLVTHIQEKERDWQPPVTRLFYYSVAPEFYQPLTQHLSQVDLITDQAKIMIEKPFGHNLSSAQALNSFFQTHCNENQIYRVDHYLAKSGVRSMVDQIFTPNIAAIDSLQFTFAEAKGIGDRGQYYDHSGAIRDFFQNHALAIISLLLSHGGEPHNRIDALKSLTIEDCITGQYQGYRQERYVDPHSRKETFVAVKLSTNMANWQHVPIFVRLGKMLPEDRTQLIVLYPDHHETIDLRHQNHEQSEYGELILSCLYNTHQLFVSGEETEAAWQVTDELLTHLPSLETYEPGTWGPARTNQLTDWV